MSCRSLDNRDPTRPLDSSYSTITPPSDNSFVGGISQIAFSIFSASPQNNSFSKNPDTNTGNQPKIHKTCGVSPMPHFPLEVGVHGPWNEPKPLNERHSDLDTFRSNLDEITKPKSEGCIIL